MRPIPRSRFFLGGCIAVLLVAAFFVMRPFEHDDGTVAGIATEGTVANINALPADTNSADALTTQPEAAIEPTDPTPSSTTPKNTESEAENKPEPPIFRHLYLGTFTGTPDVKPQNRFSTKDRIVLVVRTNGEIPPERDFTFKVLKGDKTIYDPSPMRILSGEIGLPTPERKGSYVVRIEVDRVLMQEIAFTIE